jgi:hypothetical protein
MCGRKKITKITRTSLENDTSEYYVFQERNIATASEISEQQVAQRVCSNPLRKINFTFALSFSQGKKTLA